MGESGYYEVPELWRGDRYLQVGETRRFQACARLLPDDTTSLLDVGTGNGQFLSHLEAERPELRLAGLERSAAAIRAAVCATPIEEGSADAIPLPDRGVDVVTALEVIEHFPFRVYENALGEMERVARQSILVSVPFREKLRNVVCPYCNCQFHPHNHVRSFDLSDLAALFKDFRLSKCVKVYKPSPYMFIHPLLSVYRRFGGTAAAFPATAVCPLCGYSRNADDTRRASLPTSTKAKRSWDILKRALPRREKPHWIVAVYRRIP